MIQRECWADPRPQVIVMAVLPSKHRPSWRQQRTPPPSDPVQEKVSVLSVNKVNGLDGGAGMLSGWGRSPGAGGQSGWGPGCRGPTAREQQAEPGPPRQEERSRWPEDPGQSASVSRSLVLPGEPRRLGLPSTSCSRGGGG